MPEPATARLGLVAPSGTDLISDGDDKIRGIATTLDSKAAIFAQGTLALRPVSTPGTPGITGRLYFATDVSVLYYDAGTSWTEMVPNGSVTLAKLAAALQQRVFQPGDVKHTLKTAADPGWLLAQGQQNLSKTGLPDLWAVAQAEIALGNPLFTDVNGTTFGIADLQRKVLIPAGSGFDLGDTGGAETHTLTTAQMPSHGHGTGSGANPNFVVASTIVNAEIGDPIAGTSVNYPVIPGAGTFDEVNGTAAAGGGGAHNNMQPYVVINAAVKT